MPPIVTAAGLMLVLAAPVDPPSLDGAVGPREPPAPSALDAAFEDLRVAARESEPRPNERYGGSFANAPRSSPSEGPAAAEGEGPTPTRLGNEPPIPLAGHREPRREGSPGPAGATGGLSRLVTIGSSLGAVLGLFLVMAWVLRRAAPAGSAWLPGEVVEVLGRSVLAGRAQVHLVRCGNRLLLLSVTPSGIETLTEISDPDEVNHLTALCRQGRPGSVTAAFRRVLDELAGEAESPEIAGAGRQGRAVPGVEPLRDRGIREGRHV